MPQKRILLVICFFLVAASMQGQCSPDRNGVWKKILGVIDSAKISYKEKLEILTDDLERMNNCPFRNDSTHAFLLQIIGEIYFHQADYLNAIKFYRQSIDIITANYGKPSVNPKRLILLYYWLSTLYNSVNNISEKMKVVNSCIEIAIKLKLSSDISCIRTLYERVKYSFDIGDYHRCIDDARMCERLAREYLRNVLKGTIEYNAGQGIASSSLGWYVRAQLMVNNFVAAEEFLTNKSGEYKNSGLENYLWFLYSQSANVQLSKGDYNKALTFLNNGLEYARKGKNDFACKQILNTVASEIYSKHFKNSDMALDIYKKALGYTGKGKFQTLEDRMESLNIFTGIANIYVRKDFFDMAFQNYQLAFDQIEPGFNEESVSLTSPESISKYPKLYYLVNLLITKGDAYQRKYIVTNQQNAGNKAEHIYKITDRLLETIRSKQFDLESKLFWRSDSRRLYEHAVEACYSLKNIDGAFYFFERSRAVLLNDQLIQQQWMGSSDISNWVQVNQKILILQRELSDTKSSAKRHLEIPVEIFNNTQEKQILEKLIRENNPLYYQGIDTNYITLDDVKKKLLKDRQAILEIFSGDSTVFILLITSEQNYFSRIGKNEFEQTTSLYISYLSDPGLLNRDFAGFRNVSYRLYQMIFQNNNVPPGRIIISMEGRYFPFESLISNNNTKDPVYFLNDHIVSYTYSARYLINDFSPGKSTPKGYFLGVAPVQYTHTSSLPPLTGSDGSLKTIGTFIPTTQSQIAENATRNNFLQAFPGYKVIQLYTHASGSSLRKEPVIYFADSALYLSELIPGDKPVTRLIVLSACETGSGKLYQGEGVFSFNRGFAALGIPSCIASLWSVDNISTYQLTESFYKYLSKGIPIDIALQKAKLEFLNNALGEKKLPYYWAPAVLIGKTDSITFKKPTSRIYLLLIAGLAGGFFFGLKQYNRKKNRRKYSNSL